MKEKEKNGIVSKETEISLEANVTLSDLREVLDHADPKYLQVLAPTIKEFIGLVQLATLGDSKSVEELLAKPGPYLQKLLDYDKGAILGFLKARSVGEFMTGETKKDPLEWGRLLIEIEKLQITKNLGKEAGGFGGGSDGRSPSGEAARYSNELLQEVEGDGEETGPQGSQ